jgi:DNA-3-methyladenine glycosylase I
MSPGSAFATREGWRRDRRSPIITGMSAAYCLAAPSHPLHGPYHDTEYGFLAADEAVLFERLVLEINQAGLSWLTVLQKRAAFRAAFADFAVDRVARFGAPEIARLMADPGIVRNRLKIEAVIANARKILELRHSHGSFHGWLEAHHPNPPGEWTRLFRQNFRFTGGLIVGEFLMSLGYLPGAHELDCPVYPRALALAPPWSRAIDVRSG